MNSNSYLIKDGLKHVRCERCVCYKPEEDYPHDINPKFRICIECYANDYREDINDILNTAIELSFYKDVPKDEMKEALGERFDELEILIYGIQE